MQDLIVRKLKTEELPLLFSLNNYRDPQDMLEKNGALLDRGEAAFYGLFRKGELVGEVRTKFRDADPDTAFPGRRAYLYALRIRQDHRRRGLATYLLEAAMADCRQAGYREFTIGVEDDNAIAIRLYEKLGFSVLIKRVQETYQGDSYEYSLLMRQERE